MAVHPRLPLVRAEGIADAMDADDEALVPAVLDYGHPRLGTLHEQMGTSHATRGELATRPTDEVPVGLIDRERRIEPIELDCYSGQGRKAEIPDVRIHCVRSSRGHDPAVRSGDRR